MDQEGHNHIDKLTNSHLKDEQDMAQNTILLLAIFHQRKGLVEQMSFASEDKFWCGFYNLVNESKWKADKHKLWVHIYT